MDGVLEVFVASVKAEAAGINSWEFRLSGGGDLPPFTAGSHIDLHLSNGLVRSYSLCNSPAETARYVVAINKDANSRGGSKHIHETLQAGTRIRISAPRNNFPLREDAPHTVLIAGGIGITPMLSMIHRLEALGRSWELYYSARTRELCAFQEELRAFESAAPGRVHINYDHEPGSKPTDIAALLRAAAEQAHFYCCGPNGMLKAFEEAAGAAAIAPERVHVEYFTAKEAASLDGGFAVVLRKSGATLAVEAGHTILDALMANQVDVPFSCMEGVCGTCAVDVLEGVPDHRDSVLTPQERASNKKIMVCCSGSKTPRIVLDL